MNNARNNEGILNFLHTFYIATSLKKKPRELQHRGTVASSPGLKNSLASVQQPVLALPHPPRYAPRNRTGTGVKKMQLTDLVQSCFEAATVLRASGEIHACSAPAPKRWCKRVAPHKFLAGEKLTRILARRLFQRSLASVLSQLDHRTSLSSV